MDASSEPQPTPGRVDRGAAKGKAWMLPRWPVLIGVIGLGAVVTTGIGVKRRADARQHAEIEAIRMELGSLRAEAVQYRERVTSLRWTAERIRASADKAAAEPLKSWARQRARHFDEFVARLDRRGDEAAFERMSREIETACARGDVPAARERLLQLPELRFPGPARYRELQAEHYHKPLADFSRQNPAYYQAFHEHEPEAAKTDFAALRKELAAPEIDAITPQFMLQIELLGAVAPKGDPLLEDLGAVLAAADYFENPDAATLASWRRAIRAMRGEDWPAAFAQMQSIVRSTVRTRQPFRAAYGRAILRNNPDDAASAYPYFEEAAAAGDAAARTWLIEQDLAAGRKGTALRWLEVGALENDRGSVPKLLELYAIPRTTLPRDPQRELGVLRRITTAPDAPALAWMLLARFYEEGGGLPVSPPEAFACYKAAAEKQHVPAWPLLARRYLDGDGVAPDPDQARDWACRAYAAGEREQALPVLLELMDLAPERTAGAVQTLLDEELVAGRAGFADTRIGGPGVAQLQLRLARFHDRTGNYAQAARFYEKSGSRDPGVLRRHTELTTARACETCAGVGKIRHSSPCPICSGKGTVLCAACDGRGYSFVPGSPPCSACAGSGQVQQDGRRYACSTCGGTGKAKSSVTKQTCPHCAQGRAPCRECTGGRIVVMRECPDCHGSGSRALADK